MFKTVARFSFKLNDSTIVYILCSSWFPKSYFEVSEDKLYVSKGQRSLVGVPIEGHSNPKSQLHPGINICFY